MRTCAYVVALLFLIVGCDATVDPVRKDTYSVYGYVSTSADRQFIRVKPLETPLRADANRDLDVTVTLRDLDTGTTHSLRDSVIVFVDDGDSLVTHNFWTDADIHPKTTYRLKVEGDGGVVTTAETTTPTNAPPTPIPQEGNCLTQFRIRFDEAAQKPLRIQGEFAYDGQRHKVPIDGDLVTPTGKAPYLDFIPESELLDTRIPGNETINIPFGPSLLPPRCLDLDSDTLRVYYVYGSRNWHEFDVDSSDPLNFIHYVEDTQVENGQGFFGALHRDQVAVRVDTSDTLELGASARERLNEGGEEPLNLDGF